MVIVIPIEEAKSRFDELLERVEQGEEVVLERDGASIATIARAAAEIIGSASERRFGTARGHIVLHEGWDAPMSDEELADWYGLPLPPLTSDV